MKKDCIQTPYYIVYEQRMEHNLQLITDVERRAGVNIIMAFKANALWRSFDIVRRYNRDFTASSLNELMLGVEELWGEAHVYCPVYTPETIDSFLEHATHITFNSPAQFEQYASKAREWGVSPGLRVNPEVSVVETDMYNPSLPGSRFGVSADALKEAPEGLEGLHFHCLCESTSYDLERVLEAFERDFGHLLPGVKWVNMGGGHLMTRKGYDVDHLIALLKGFRSRYPGLQVILEPGSAWMWQTGNLVTTVLDVVESQGIKTAIIDASFACHMPDTLEMPYQPAIAEADENGEYVYRLGGNSCLSGDWIGDWTFARPLEPGTRLTLLDMNHYTTVKTTMFNGIRHPSILLQRTGEPNPELLREFTYEDYKTRMS